MKCGPSKNAAQPRRAFFPMRRTKAYCRRKLQLIEQVNHRASFPDELRIISHLWAENGRGNSSSHEQHQSIGYGLEILHSPGNGPYLSKERTLAPGMAQKASV
jgi:hypothetical protein